MNDRYYMINGTALKKYKTIEVRLHSGTTNFNKIKNWVELLKGIVKSEAPIFTSLDSMLETINATGIS